ncbi:glycosyltransferase family 2 protein [Geobacter sp.]|uniref:glycosyltransferase family 2 protein n=1 Tax=Geobacter sp. TaxID=46610 RepID=UPI002617AE60|nr:glycosyltransferase family 2 protein [Geobacter sp.]
MTTSVYIIVVNWNNWKDTVECVESCRRLAYPEVRLLVVDNGSTDDSVEKLRRRFPDLELILTGMNLGFAGGNNVGIRYALEHGADYIWLLNNDAIVDPNALTALVCVAEENELVGMVGSKIPFFEKPHLLWYAGAVLDTEKPYRSGHRGLGEEDRGQYDVPEQTGYVTGCSLLVRRQVVEEIGLLDEGLFLYFEDSDWCARARRAGWKLFYAPQSVVLHKVSSSIGGAGSPFMRYYLARNLLYFVAKNYPGTLFRTVLFDVYANVLVPIKKGKFSSALWAIRGMRDFFLKRKGMAPLLRPRSAS